MVVLKEVLTRFLTIHMIFHIVFLIFTHFDLGILSENMVKFKEFLYVEFMKVREDLFSMRANANYLKSNRPTEWDKVVEFDDRLVMCKCLG